MLHPLLGLLMTKLNVIEVKDKHNNMCVALGCPFCDTTFALNQLKGMRKRIIERIGRDHYIDGKCPAQYEVPTKTSLEEFMHLLHIHWVGRGHNHMVECEGGRNRVVRAPEQESTAIKIANDNGFYEVENDRVVRLFE